VSLPSTLSLREPRLSPSTPAPSKLGSPYNHHRTQPALLRATKNFKKETFSLSYDVCKMKKKNYKCFV
jgi:hypothetical protein